ncbi:MAG TPA: hypothetical protein VFN35_05005 [Ktedonobacteraceae bacterium]|nr:hypothetical protein [Ktedonobacteraceae bacterium]
MDINQIKDPAVATGILEDLAQKDLDETICRYPTCQQPRVAPGAGRPSAYCDNKEHTALNNHRARQALKTLALNKPPVEAEGADESASPVVAIHQVESLRGSVVNGMVQLQNNLERYLETLKTIADPDIASAQLQAATARLDSRLADMQERLSTEISLRLAADASRQAAQEESTSSKDAADLAINKMEEAEARTLYIQEEAAQQLATLTEETEQQIASARRDAQHAIEVVEQEAKSAVEQAQAETHQAQRQAQEAEMNSRTQVAAAERLVQEAQKALEQERAEVQRLRADLADTRSQSKADRDQAQNALEQERAEVQRLRTTLVQVQAQANADRDQAQKALEQERAEVQRLRTELARVEGQRDQTTKRADQLAAENDELRKKQVPPAPKEQPGKKA